MGSEPSDSDYLFRLGVSDATSGTAVVLSANVSAPPIPPPDAGKCIISRASRREICYPKYEDLDTTCTDVSDRSASGLVAPPVIPHAT
ncbi:down-regulator of invasive growth [Parelaphostrongylus tenuis]|uniref:Down-regulator of invasive growth n=1 Tax=Parelaphostrongylus tenuis TaxID=148309 RepID=A0AAD5QGM2_PARTN|nr:down-regulator of invasive growth [Parelaphostrongylus tenuis]